MLMDELRSWPNVTERPMFGFHSFYRGPQIFAALPRTRSVFPNALMFKLPVLTPEIRRRLERDAHIDASSGERWINFELSAEEDIHAALNWLELAYEAAKKRQNLGRKRSR